MMHLDKVLTDDSVGLTKIESAGHAMEITELLPPDLDRNRSKPPISLAPIVAPYFAAAFKEFLGGIHKLMIGGEP
jgi:hypothetical protein